MNNVNVEFSASLSSVYQLLLTKSLMSDFLQNVHSTCRNVSDNYLNEKFFL